MTEVEFNYFIFKNTGQDNRLHEEAHNSLKFAASAQTVSLGVDRHGRTLKDSSKLNVSTIYDRSNANQSSILKSFSSTILEQNKLKGDESLFYSRSLQHSSQMSITSSDSGGWSNGARSLDPEDYKKWKKVELIDDLVYYKEHSLKTFFEQNKNLFSKTGFCQKLLIRQNQSLSKIFHLWKPVFVKNVLFTKTGIRQK